MDEVQLERRLRDAFAGDPGEFEAVVRMTRDLDDGGAFEADAGHPLTPAVIVEHLEDAPSGTVADRWNWWMGALDVAYGGYASFQVRHWKG